MRTVMALLLLIGLMSPAGIAPAQTAAEVSPADVAAVSVYRESMSKLRAELRAAQNAVKEKNIALAKALGKTNDYNEKEVTARHAELAVAQQRLAAVELNGFLLYKKYNPTWKPDVSGRKVGTAAPAGSGQRQAQEHGDPLGEDDL